MDKHIKLICLDLDGTTLRDISTISDRNVYSIKKAYDMGIKIAFVTGRLFVHSMYFSQVIGIKPYIICNNGTYVYDTISGSLLYSSFLGVDNLVKIYKFVKGKNFNVHYSTIDTIYSNTEMKDYVNEHVKGKYTMNVFVVYSEDYWKSIFKNKGDQICKAVIACDDNKKLEIVLEEIRKTDEFEVEYSWINTVEILKKGDGKGNGIKVLKGYLGLNTENVMCIGDGENDISMFCESGCRVAMGNAIDKLKDKADFITLNVSEDGVAYAIERLLENY